MTENFSEQLLQHDGDIMNKLDTEQYKSFSQILENPDEENLNKWLEDNLSSEEFKLCMTKHKQWSPN